MAHLTFDPTRPPEGPAERLARLKSELAALPVAPGAPPPLQALQDELTALIES